MTDSVISLFGKGTSFTALRTELGRPEARLSGQRASQYLDPSQGGFYVNSSSESMLSPLLPPGGAVVSYDVLHIEGTALQSERRGAVFFVLDHEGKTVAAGYHDE